MAIIKQYHPDTQTTYVYESTYYWDADKQQSRSKRKLIGKVDPKTGETVPTGKRGPKREIEYREPLSRQHLQKAHPAKKPFRTGRAGKVSRESLT